LTTATLGLYVQNNVGHMKLMQQRTYIMYIYHGYRTFAIVRKETTTLFTFKKETHAQMGAYLMGNTYLYILIVKTQL